MGGRGTLLVRLLVLLSEHWRIGLAERSKIIYLLKHGKRDLIKLTRIISKTSLQKTLMRILGKLPKNLRQRFQQFFMPAAEVKSL